MKRCRFYDDGHGNGSYIPGASCGPPLCNLGGSSACNGNVTKCNVKNKREKELKKEANKILKEI